LLKRLNQPPSGGFFFGATMVDLNALTAANARRWQNAKLTRKTQSDNIAAQLFRTKKRYQDVADETGVPWPIVAVIHERESSQNFTTQLGQGDPLNRVSVHVPAGRGPFDTWEEGAHDALVNCPPYLARRKDWSLSAALTALELYNGIGYAAKGVPSPYLWSGTDQYRAGKYVADGVYDPNKVDAQLGCAALLMSLMALDPSITFTGAKIIPAAPVPPARPSQPSITNPSPGSIGAFLVSIFAAIFKRPK
jgi:lysozyme family protein